MLPEDSECAESKVDEVDGGEVEDEDVEEGGDYGGGDASEGGERYVAGETGGDGPGKGAKNEGDGGHYKDGTGRGHDAASTLEAEEEGPVVSGEDKEPGGDVGRGLAGDYLCQEDGEGTFAEVEDKDQGRALEATGTQNIAGTRSAAAVLAHVDAVEEADDEEAPGNGTQDVCERDEDEVLGEGLVDVHREGYCQDVDGEEGRDYERKEVLHLRDTFLPRLKTNRRWVWRKSKAVLMRFSR